MANFTNSVKNVATLTGIAKSAVSTFTNELVTRYNQYLLLEDGGYLLMEDGGRIILDQNVPQRPTITNLAKS